MGGEPYLLSLIRSVPTSLRAEGYTQIVRREAAQRRLLELKTQGAAIDTAGLITHKLNLTTWPPIPLTTEYRQLISSTRMDFAEDQRVGLWLLGVLIKAQAAGHDMAVVTADNVISMWITP